MIMDSVVDNNMCKGYTMKLGVKAIACIADTKCIRPCAMHLCSIIILSNLLLPNITIK